MEEFTGFLSCLVKYDWCDLIHLHIKCARHICAFFACNLGNQYPGLSKSNCIRATVCMVHCSFVPQKAVKREL